MNFVRNLCITSDVGLGIETMYERTSVFLVYSWSERDHGVDQKVSSKMRSRLSLRVDFPTCSSSLPLKRRIVSNLVNSRITSSWFVRKESFDDEQAFARGMRVL